MMRRYRDAGQIPEIELPRPPDSVLIAVKAMYACTVACVTHAIMDVLTLGAATVVIARKRPYFRASHVGTPQHVAPVVAVLAALVAAGLFAWLARPCESGKHWARVTGTVICLIGVSGAIYDLASSPRAVDGVLCCVDGLKGLFVVVLLWLGSSNEYFRSVKRPRCAPGRPSWPGRPS